MCLRGWKRSQPCSKGCSPNDKADAGGKASGWNQAGISVRDEGPPRVGAEELLALQPDRGGPPPESTIIRVSTTSRQTGE